MLPGRPSRQSFFNLDQKRRTASLKHILQLIDEQTRFISSTSSNGTPTMIRMSPHNVELANAHFYKIELLFLWSFTACRI